MKRCKYLLPCGRCDQRGALCDVTVEQLNIHNSLELPKECNHSWITEKAEAVTKEEAGCITYYTRRCSICGKEQIKRIEVSGDHKFDITIWELKT